MAADPTYAQATALQRATRTVAGTRPGRWFFARALQPLDEIVLRATRSRHSFTSLFTALPVVELTTTGARSGLPRTAPVVGIDDESGLAVIASNFGQASHPAWYFNLRADPHGTVATPGGASRPFRARVAEGEERERIWRRALALYPAWGRYEVTAGDRRIAVFVLEPADPRTEGHAG